VQSLGRRGHRVFVIDHEPYVALAHSRFCAGLIHSPRESQTEEYMVFLLDLIKSGEYDLLIPISDACVGMCVNRREELKKYIRLVVPEKETYAKVADKRLTCLFAIDRGIPIPRTYFPPDREALFSMAQNSIYPCVVKMPFSSASKGVFFINSKQELIRLYESQNFQGQWPIIQERIIGEFFGITGVAHQGRVLASLIHTTNQEFSLGGTPPISYSVNNTELMERAGYTISQLKWTGAFNLDYINMPDRGFRLLEINPRFAGSLNFSYRMGLDLPFVYYHLAFDGSPDDIQTGQYADGIMFRTIFPSEIMWLCQHRDYLGRFLKNFLNLRAKSNIYWDDLPLIWWQAKETRWHCQDMKISADNKKKGLLCD